MAETPQTPEELISVEVDALSSQIDTILKEAAVEPLQSNPRADMNVRRRCGAATLETLTGEISCSVMAFELEKRKHMLAQATKCVALNFRDESKTVKIIAIESSGKLRQPMSLDEVREARAILANTEFQQQSQVAA